MSEQDLPSQAGSSGVNQSGPTLLTAQAVSDIVREAVGGVKNYIDEAMNVQKKESDKVLESTSKQFEQLKKSSQVQFRFKGNKTQFEFNAQIAESLQKASACLVDGKAILAKEIVDKAV